MLNILQPNNITEARKDRKFFTMNEDELLKMIAWRCGAKNWILIASMIPGKTARQCRDRYMNYLAPGLCHADWTKEDDDLLKKLYKEFGPKWSLIAKQLPNRSPINVKNRWAHFLGKKISSAASSLKISNLNSSSSDTESYNSFVEVQQKPNDIKMLDINTFLSSMSNSNSGLNKLNSNVANLEISRFQLKEPQIDNKQPNRIIFPSLMDLSLNHSVGQVPTLCF